ncbi:MAG TPA: hypothetical protein VK507_16185 [Iamia sp.]|nr:hypothetical protein [Iamia sp.]
MAAPTGWEHATVDDLWDALAWWPAGVVPLIEALDYRVDLTARTFADVDGQACALAQVFARLRSEQIHVTAYIRAAAMESRGELPSGTIVGWTGPGTRIEPLAEQAAALWNNGADGDRFPLDGERLRYLYQARPQRLLPVLRAVGLVAYRGDDPAEPVLRGAGGVVTDLDEAVRRIEARPDLAKLVREALYQISMQESRSGEPLVRPKPEPPPGYGPPVTSPPGGASAIRAGDLGAALRISPSTVLPIIEELGFTLVTMKPEPTFRTAEGDEVDLHAVFDRIDRTARYLKGTIYEIVQAEADRWR